MTPSTASGDAYTAPSSLTAFTTRGVPAAGGMARDTPARAGSPGYAGQSGALRAMPRADVAGAGGTGGDVAGVDGPVLDGPVLDGPVLDGPVLDGPVLD